MAKRFTDSEKWRKPWFRSLSLRARVTWVYLTDNCDHAGVWPAAFDLMSGDLGFKVDAADLETWFDGRVVQISSDKYFIPGYVEFQYGELSEESKPHQSVIKILVKYGIDPKNLTLSKEYPKGSETLKDKDKEKAKAKDQEGEFEGKQFLAKLYSLFPNKKGKSPGLKKLAADLKAGADPRDMARALDAFIDDHRARGTDKNFIPQFKTWANSWRDCLDPDYGATESFSAPLTDAEAKERALFEQEPA